MLLKYINMAIYPRGFSRISDKANSPLQGELDVREQRRQRWVPKGPGPPVACLEVP